MAANVPPVPDERAGLLGFLAQQRYLVKVAAHGLSDEQARATPTVSALSVGGLLKHLAATERSWIDMIVASSPGRPDDGPAHREDDGEADYGASFRLGDDETLADMVADYDAAGAETEAVIAAVADLGQPVPVPRDVPWYPDDIDAWSVRWVLLHLIEETARHAGHADIVREGVDGATAYPLMAAAEGWEPTPWIQPWQPPSR